MCGVFMPATALLLLHINLFSYFCIFLIAERTVCETRVQSEIRYKKKHNRKQMNREKSSLHSLGWRGSPGGGQRLPRVRDVGGAFEAQLWGRNPRCAPSGGELLERKKFEQQ